MYYILYSYNKVSYREENVIKKILRNKKQYCCIYRYHKFTLSVYKINGLPVLISIWYYMIQITVDVTHITNTRYQKGKDNVKNKCIFIYK